MPRIGPTLRVALVLALVSVLAAGATIAGRALGSDPSRPDIVDFNVFHLAGRLAWQGRLADAYGHATMADLERSLGQGRDTYMPYAYPPAFGLFASVLALVPSPVAFAIFASASLAAFLLAMRQLGGPWAWPATLATAPALFINLLVGQNGMMTAALAALATGLTLTGRRGWGAVAAGALAALKPQAAAALPLLFLVRRDGRAIAAMAATAAAASGLAIAILGPATLPAFLNGLSESSRFMTAGRFPLHRLTSVYACALDLGTPAWLALLLHGGVAMTVVAVALTVDRRSADRRAAAGVTVMATVFVSPYFYDYDLTVLGIGLVLVLPALARGRWRGRIGFLLVTLAGIESAGFVEGMTLPIKLSLGGPSLLAWFMTVVAGVIDSREVGMRAPSGSSRRAAALASLPPVPANPAELRDVPSSVRDVCP